MEVASRATLGILRARDVRWEPMDRLRPGHREILEAMLQGEDRYIDWDGDLGWTLVAGEASGRSRSNGQGLRGGVEYPPAPGQDILRILTFGDSFTHGDGVANHETWQSVLEGSRTGLEVPNFGVSGYGPDQALLRFRHHPLARTGHLVFIGVMAENPSRVVNRFRPFYYPRTGQPFGKPRFRFVDGELGLLANPLPDEAAYRELLENPGPVLRRIGEGDEHFESGYLQGPLDRSGLVRVLRIALHQMRQRREAHPPQEELTSRERLTASILLQFATEVSAASMEPVILYFPSAEDLAALAAGETPRYQRIGEAVRRAGREVIDLADAFEGVPVADVVIPDDGHFGPEGHRRIAEFLQNWLATRRDSPPFRTARNMQYENP